MKCGELLKMLIEQHVTNEYKLLPKSLKLATMIWPPRKRTISPNLSSTTECNPGILYIRRRSILGISRLRTSPSPEYLFQLDGVQQREKHRSPWVPLFSFAPIADRIGNSAPICADQKDMLSNIIDVIEILISASTRQL